MKKVVVVLLIVLTIAFGAFMLTGCNGYDNGNGGEELPGNGYNDNGGDSQITPEGPFEQVAGGNYRRFVGSLETGGMATMRYGAIVRFLPNNVVVMTLTFNSGTFEYEGTYTKTATPDENVFVDYDIVITYYARHATMGGMPPALYISEDVYNDVATVLNLTQSGNVINGFRPQMAGTMTTMGFVPTADIVLVYNGPAEYTYASREAEVENVFVGSVSWQGGMGGTSHLSIILTLFDDGTVLVETGASTIQGLAVTAITGEFVECCENATINHFFRTNADGYDVYSTTPQFVVHANHITGFRISTVLGVPALGGQTGALLVRVI